MSDLKPILSAKNIRKSFLRPNQVEILKGVSLDLHPGESIAIIGASGEGKSTLLHILGTLEEATSGELFVMGRPALLRPAPILRNRHIGFVFQNFNLLEDYSVLHNVLMPALISGKEIGKQSDSYKRAVELLTQVGLKEKLHFSTKLLSGGEKQRSALARALCNDPEILLADEPSGNLDHETSRQIHQLLINSVSELKKGLIVVTHDEELAALCQRRYILSDGYLHSE